VPILATAALPRRRPSLTPGRVAVDASGNVYVADKLANRVRQIATTGTIKTIAVNGTQGYSGDGGPATQAQLSWPVCVALDSAGNLYIADYFNSRIRKVAVSGMITTLVGNGNRGFAGDGGPAADAELSYPNAVAVASTGALFIADDGNNRTRFVSPPASGQITSTIAGNGTYRFSGDGGPASSAALWSPLGLGLDGRGNLYIARRV
jgi:hypothetical protein